MTAYRARRVLEEACLGPADLTRRWGRSKTTWSRFLAGEREPKTGSPRREVEQLLREHGWQDRVTGDLWRREGAPERNANPEDEGTGEINMQGQTLSTAALRHFQLFMSPFDPEAIIDPTTGGDRLDDLHLPVSHQFVEARLVQALVKAGFVAVAGEPGSGKSTLLERASRRAGELKPIKKVTPANVERRKLTAVHVAAEIIRQLSEESVPRTANARDALAAEILRQRYELGQRVALVIDEAHELPHATIKDLKRYHEMTHGFARLLAIVLIGQTELAERFNLERNHALREVIIRCQLVHLPPMAGDVDGYLRKRFSWIGAELEQVFEPRAVRAIEARLALHNQQLPVLIGNAATAAMNIAARRGSPVVSEDDVEAVWQTSAEQLQELGL